MKKNIKTEIIRIVSLLAIIGMVPFFSGCGSQSVSYSVSLEVWSPFDDSSDFSSIVEQYKKVNPFVGNVVFKKFSPDTYKSELIDALASGNGPDIYLINNAWLPSFENKLSPAPVVSQDFPTALVSEQNIKDGFPDTVDNDFVDKGNVYAVPLTVDSLELYYNKDIFNAAGITAAPTTWDDFKSDVQKITVVDPVGNITRQGAALGNVKNINSHTDILEAMMFQQGVNFPTKNGANNISDGVIGPDGSIVMGAENALQYYTQFAKLSTDSGVPNPYYTWNDNNHYSIDAFTEGTLGMMLNYSWQIKAIQNKNPKLNFAVAPIPQMNPSKPTTISNYWGFGVSLNKLPPQASSSQTGNAQVSQGLPNNMRVFEAWQFLRFLTLKNSGSIKIFNAYTKTSKDFPIAFDPAADYLKKTQQPAARRDLIELQKTDPLMGPFATGNLIAKNWWQPDPDQVNAIFENAIQSVDNGSTSVHDAVGLASTKINMLVRGK
jgi:ABC-type glycerol-3-phosphate transport system substrate-binding protein